MIADISSLLGPIAFICGAILTLGAMVMGIVFLLSLQRALDRCSPGNRTLAPGKVWLCLIPVFNAAWIFVVVSRVASSLRREFESRGAPSGDYGRAIGLTYGILAATALAASLIAFVAPVAAVMPGDEAAARAAAILPFTGAMDATVGIACLVCLIVFWVTISGYSRTLRRGAAALEAGWGRKPAEVAEGSHLGQAWLALLILMLAAAAQQVQAIALTWFSRPLQHQFGLTLPDLGVVFSSYTFGLIAGCVLMTIVTCLCGTRWGLAAALVGMSLASAGWTLVSGQSGLIAARACSGFFAGGLLPAAIQSLREYFPSSKRPLAIGIFIASSPLAALLALPLGPRIAAAMDWRTAMTYTGAPSLVVAALCWFIWRRPARPARPLSVSAAGIVSTVMLGAGVLFCAPLLIFVQTWAPMLAQRTGAGLAGFPAVAIGAGAAGALIAGVAAWAAMRAGASSWRARAALLTLCGVLLLIAGLWGASRSDSVWLLSALVVGAFQAWSTLLYAAVADTLPMRGVSVGAAAGTIILAEAGLLATPWLGAMMTAGGPEAVFVVATGLAAAGLACVAVLAWFVHPGAPRRPAAGPAAA